MQLGPEIGADASNRLILEESAAEGISANA